MKKYLFSSLAMIATSSIMLSCSSASSELTDDWEEPHKVVNWATSPQPIELTEEQKVFANDNNGFTFNFIKAVNDINTSGASFIYSPLSITYLLGMTNDAATGTTEKEIEQTLGFHEGGIQAVNEYCKKLIEGLPKVDESVKFNIANAIFLNKQYKLNKQFEQDMQYYYDAKAEALDFSSPQAADVINRWCKEKTHDMIPKVLEETDDKMVSFLLNAIYFKADWTSKFDTKYTKTETFTKENGQTQLPLMHQKVLIEYAKNEIFSALKIPYGKNFWTMTVMLPEEGKTTDDIINELAKSSSNKTTQDNPWEILQNNNSRLYEVDLKLPRFETASDTQKLENEEKLIGVLKKMGIQRAFTPEGSEIPNMCESSDGMGGMNLYISMMQQIAKIEVNEEGSEAAAVTIGGFENTCEGPDPEFPKATFHANRPFVYVISEASSGVILFVGKFTGA